MVQTCLWCGFEAQDAESLLAHIMTSHAPGQPSVAPPEPLSKGCARRKRDRPSTEAQPSTSTGAERGTRPASKSEVSCEKCVRSFKHKRSLLRHVREKHGEGVKCEQCSRQFVSQRTLKMHIKHSAGRCNKVPLKCRGCKRRFENIRQLILHRRESCPRPRLRRRRCDGCCRKYNSLALLRLHQRGCAAKKQKSATSEQRLRKVRERVVGLVVDAAPSWSTEEFLEGNAVVHSFETLSETDLQLTLLNNKDNFVSALKSDIVKLRRFKFYIVAHVQTQGEGGDVNLVKYMRSSPFSCLRVTEIQESVESAILGVINSFDKAVMEGSKILFEKVLKLEIRVAKYSPIRGSSYLPLPTWLKKSSKGLINIKNFADKKCFLWSCLAGTQLPDSHPERLSQYRGREGEFDMTGIKYPVSLSQIDRFEENNPFVSVTVFGLEQEKTVVPLRVTKRVSPLCHINLLLLQDVDSEDCHFILIKDLSRFLAHLYRGKKRMFWCENCLTPQFNPDAHARHRERCLTFTSQGVQMPRDDAEHVMKFTEYEKQVRHDYVIYCDLESILTPINTCVKDPSVSGSTRVNEHTPSGYCYVVVGADGKLVKEPVLGHGGEGLMREFLLKLKAEEQEIKDKRGEKYPLDMTPASRRAFSEATQCYLCKEKLPRLGVKKVRDHNHFQEFDNYRGAACHGCNLNLKNSDYIPVFFHNFSGYDAHHLISEIGSLSDGSDLSAIPKTKERYISFSWGNLRFLDSLNFLSSSLDKLVQDVKPEDMKILNFLFPDPQKRALLSRKGVYPYSYFDCFEKFDEPSLPPPAAFKNDLTEEEVSENDYEHCKNVFKVFQMSSLWDYHDLYLLADTLQLCDVMEAFRALTMDHMQLDVVHFYTTPGYTWTAALLYTQQRLQLLTDIDMYQMFEMGIRGGVSSINHRYSEANNPYISDSFDASKPEEYIMYLDANNLYAAGLQRPLPTKNFRFLSESEISCLDISSIQEDDPTGYLFEVDLMYPDHLHDAHNDFCLAPEHIKPSYDELSDLQKMLIEMYGLPRDCSTKKLIPNLKDKKKYVVFGTTLKLYIELGMVAGKIHRVVAFDQERWLAPYIKFNTEMRKKAISDFQKNLWKLLNNACFGKCIEQVRNRRNVNFTKCAEKFKKLVRSPLFHSYEVFDHNLVIVERKKARVLLNKPVYSGQVVLDISKEIMYSFHYLCMKPLYGANITVCGTDTDSLIYRIKTKDVYKDFESKMDWFDFSDYPAEHPLYSISNKKVVGKFKDEMNGDIITSYVGLRAKMYSFKRKGGVEKCVGKGIPRAALKAQLKHKDYIKVLKEKVLKNVTFNKISTDQRHHLFTTRSTKRGLSCYDDKRYIQPDNVHTLAFGHYSLREEQGGSNMETDDETRLEELMECMEEVM